LSLTKKYRTQSVKNAHPSTVSPNVLKEVFNSQINLLENKFKHGRTKVFYGKAQ
jgi:hypothetical protein